ncbi:MAG: choice-of-anchor Q domain-containing protein [Bacteroidales bacterium]
MKRKFMIIFLWITILLSGFACKKEEIMPIIGELRPLTGDFYVSVSGDDNNPGTDSLPFKTIQKAVNTVSAGEVIVVKPGHYNECVTVSKEGTGEDSRITIFSQAINGAKVFGFKIKGNFITIDGFEIEADASKTWTGVLVSGKDYIEILNCFIHDCPTGAINLTGGADYALVKNNTIEHNGQCGINIIGTFNRIEGNTISRTVQYHPKGDEPGFVGNDADGIRVFGNDHLIKGNKIINIGDPDDSGNNDPHVDCIQTWDGSTNGQPVMTNTIIEGNFLSVKHFTGKGILLETNAGNPCHDIIIRNNIFEFRDIGVAAFSGEFNNIYISNNVFKSTLTGTSWGTSASLKDVTNYTFINNITVDCHNEHRKIRGGNGTIDYNFAWNSDGSKFTMEPDVQPNEKIGIDPKFAKYTGKHGENDYHLQTGSPAIDAAFSAEQVTDDFDGITRPQGSAYDFGAFEYH